MSILRQQQQQKHQQQQQQQKHQLDKENAAAAAVEQADKRAAELRQLEQLLGATVASGGLKHLDLQLLNVSWWQ